MREAPRRVRAETARVTLEERLQCLLVHSSSILFSCEPSADYRVIFMSESARDMLGYEAREFVKDPELWMQLIHTEDLEKVRNALGELSAKSAATIEYRLLHADGYYLWVRDEYRLLCDEASTPREIVGNRIDITRFKEMEELLNQAKRELEERIQDSTRALERQAHHSEQMSKALSVLMEQREMDRNELEETVLSNVKALIEPYLTTLKRSGLRDEQLSWLRTLEEHLKDITFSFVRRLSDRHLRLTPTELRVASLIREGKTSREIARLLHVSENAIVFHRHNLRTKLGLKSKKISLVTYLQSLDH